MKWRLCSWLVLGVAIVGLLAVAAPGTAASVQTHNYEDLLFTSVRDVNDAEIVEEDGYAAATRGGLVVWPGEGDRSVYTRTEGMPSNLAWSVETVGSAAFVGTEFGAAEVGLASGEISTLDVPGVPSDSAEAAVVDVEVEDGTLYLLHRESGLATYELDTGAWEVHEFPEDARADGVALTEEGPLVSFRPNEVAALDEEGGWNTLFNTPSRPGPLASTGEHVFAGTLEDGVVVATREGEIVDEDRPEALDGGTVHTLVEEGGTVWTAAGGTLFAARGPGSWSSSEAPVSGAIRGLALLPGASFESFPEDVAVGAHTGLYMPADGNDAWTVHSTLNGPLTNVFREPTIIEGEVWAGTDQGASVFNPDRNTWRHIGPLQGLLSQPVHRIEPGEDRTWFATEGGAWGLSEDPKQWLVLVDENPSERPGNLFYDLEPDGDTLWMPELGNGLLEHDIPTNETKRYEIPAGLLSHGLLCAEQWHEFLAVCSVEAFQLFNLTQRNEAQPLGPPHDFCVGQACGSNYPAVRTFTALPDGPQIWTGTVDEGVVRIERTQGGNVTVTGHWNEEAGLPSGQVRSLAHAEHGVYAGTDEGLALVHEEAGVVQTWDRSDGLDDTTITGLERGDDVLYVSTLSGLYRLSLDDRTLLPLSDPTATIEPPEPELEIEYPPADATLFGSVNATGSARADARPIDAVEVRVGNGSWQTAEGAEEWFALLDLSDLEPGEHTLEARLIVAGETLAEASHVVEVAPEDADATAPRIEHTPPEGASPGQRLVLPATVEGEEPLRVQLRATVNDRPWVLTRQAPDGEVAFGLDLPRDATGSVEYRLHLQTAAGDRTVPTEGSFEVPLQGPAPSAPNALRVELDGAAENGTLRGSPGDVVTFTARAANDGVEAREVTLAPGGTVAPWASVDADASTIEPGEEAAFEVTVEVPETAAPGASFLDLVAQVDGESEESAHAPLTVVVLGEAPASAQNEQAQEDSGSLGVPAPSALAATVAALAAAGARRRWKA